MCRTCSTTFGKSKWGWFGHLKVLHPEIYDRMVDDKRDEQDAITAGILNISDGVS